ncbi:MAG: ATPase [Bacteroidales bacterium]|nr:ATPase [Bacteroidales bacterium]
MEPIILAYIGAALMMALPGVGSAFGFAICGNAAIGAMKKRSEGFGSYLILSGIPSSNGIYGFIAFFLTLGHLYPHYYDINYVQAGAIFGSGLILGLVSMFAAIKQAEICASGIASIASGQPLLGKTLMFAAFPEFFAILSLLCMILITGAVF